MPPKSKAEVQKQRAKLANSYHELLSEFSSKDLRTVGNYNLGRLIGKGSFGKVYLATHKLTNGSKMVSRYVCVGRVEVCPEGRREFGPGDSSPPTTGTPTYCEALRGYCHRELGLASLGVLFWG